MFTIIGALMVVGGSIGVASALIGDGGATPPTSDLPVATGDSVGAGAADVAAELKSALALADTARAKAELVLEATLDSDDPTASEARAQALLVLSGVEAIEEIALDEEVHVSAAELSDAQAEEVVAEVEALVAGLEGQLAVLDGIGIDLGLVNMLDCLC